MLIHIARSVLLIWSGNQRNMRQHHWEIGEERSVFIILYEIQKKLRKYIRPISVFVRSATFLSVNIRIPIALVTRRVIAFAPGPHAIFIETDINHRFGLNPKVVHLPLSSDGGCVTGILHHAGQTWVAFPVIATTTTPTRHVPMRRHHIIRAISAYPFLP